MRLRRPEKGGSSVVFENQLRFLSLPLPSRLDRLIEMLRCDILLYVLTPVHGPSVCFSKLQISHVKLLETSSS